MKRTIIYIALIIPLMLVSCRHDVLSSDRHDVPEQGWAVTDTILMSIQVADTTQTYDRAITLRHTELYSYQNLWFFVFAQDSLSPVRQDTVMACLADDRGQWLARRAGRYYAGYVTMQSGVKYPATGKYTYAIVHGMRDSLVYGIADIGLELRKHYGQE